MLANRENPTGAEHRHLVSIPALNPEIPYYSRLSARSAMYSDLSILLHQTSEPLSAVGLRELVTVDNALSRSSTSARRKTWKELKARYILDPDHPLFMAFWREWLSCITETEHAQTAYCLLTLNDRLVADLGIILLFPLLRKAPAALRVEDVLAFIDRSKSTHPEAASWSEKTKRAVAQKYTASIRDFGLARGVVKKTTVRPALYGPPIRLLIRALKMAGRGDFEIIQDPIFRLFAIRENEIVDALSALHRTGALHFRMQGDIVEIELGSPS